jgi:hypothetical protein
MNTGQKSAIIHPDENRLAAFAERALRGAERRAVVAHLADCARCREIVFLARGAGAGFEGSPQKVAHPIAAGRRWQVAVGTVGAALVAVALLVWEGRRPSVPSGYHETAETVASQDKTPSRYTPAAKAPAIKPGSIPHDSGRAIETELQARNREEKAASKQTPAREFALRSRAAPSLSGEHGAGSKLATSVAGALPVQGRDVSPQKSGPEVPPTTAATAQAEASSMPRSVAESVAVTAGANIRTEEAGSHAVSGAFSESVISVPEFNVVKGKLRRRDASGFRIVPLPNGTKARAVASSANIVLVLSRSRRVYRSTDFGDHWAEVPIQWQGKAARLEAESAIPAQPSAAIQAAFSGADAGAAGGVAAQAPPPASTPNTGTNSPTAASPSTKATRSAESSTSATFTFVLTSNAGKRWISHDGGQTWLPE